MPAFLAQPRARCDFLGISAFAGILQDLFVSAFDTPGDHKAASFSHHLQHLFVHIIHPAVGHPLDVDFLVDHPLAQFHYLIAVYRKQVGIHIDVVDAQFLELPQLFHDELWRSQTHTVLVTDVLDTVYTTGCAAAAGDEKGKRAFHHRHAILGQRQQLVHGNGQVIQVSDERAWHIENDLTLVAPGQAFDFSHVQGAIRSTCRLVGRIVLVEQDADIFRAFRHPVFQVVQ